MRALAPVAVLKFLVTLAGVAITGGVSGVAHADPQTISIQAQPSSLRAPAVVGDASAAPTSDLGAEQAAGTAAAIPAVALLVEVFEAEPGALGEQARNVAGSPAGAEMAIDIRSLEARGVVAALAERSYVTRSGGTFTLRMSGEPSFAAPRTPRANSYSVSLELRPTVLGDDVVALRVDTHTAMLDGKDEGVEPATTVVKLHGGGGVLLGGVARIHDVGPRAKSGLLAKLPWLNRLGRRGIAPTEKDLLVLVSPRLLKPDGPEAPAGAKLTVVRMVAPATPNSLGSEALTEASAAQAGAHARPVRAASASRLTRWAAAPLHLLRTAAHYVRMRAPGSPDRVLAMR